MLNYNRPLHLFASLTAAATLVLIFIGGLVTSTQSGLSVPDWPNTYGRFMFAFPLADMVGGILFEHTHRMIASIVGLLTVALAIWLWRSDTRAWVVRLGFIAVAAVIVQGVLGGLTVLFLLPTPISVTHAALAQTFFLIVLSLAYITSREYVSSAEPAVQTERARLARNWTLAAVGFIYLQLLLGAIMRHTGAGLAFTDFPQMGGALWPSFSAESVNRVNWEHWQAGLSEATSGQMVLHFLHRIMALGVTAAIIGMVVAIRREGAIGADLNWMGLVAVTLLAVQIALGAVTVLTLKQPVITTAHVANGAALLGWCALIFLRVQHLTQLKLLPMRARQQLLKGVATA